MSNKRFHKILFLLFFTLLIIFVVFIGINQFFLSKKTEEVVLHNVKNIVLTQEKQILKFLAGAEDQLNAVNESPVFKTYLRDPSKHKSIEETFMLLAQSDSNIMQIRYLDAAGYEKLRIHRDKYNHKPQVIMQNNLQNKSNRYYFKHSKEKTLGVVWHSNLDLNVEFNAIDIPYTPTIRSILPLGSSKIFKGVLIINHFASPLLKELSRFPLYDLILCDKQGNTLFHYNKEYSWSKYSSKKYNIKQLLPNDYDTIINKKFYATKHLVSSYLNVPLDGGIISILQFKKKYIDKVQRNVMERIVIEFVLFVFIAGLSGYLLSRRLHTTLSENEELVKQEKLFNETFERAPIGIAHANLHGEWIKVNSALSKILGFSNKELLQMTFQGVTHPDDLGKELSEVKRLLNGEIETFQLRKRYLDKNGKIVWAELTASLVRDKYKQPEYFIKIVNEINKRKELEVRLSEYLKLIDANIITSTTDTRGIITNVSAAFCEISGYSKEELIGQSHNIVRHPEMSNKTFSDLWQTIKANKTWHGEIKNVRKEGTFYWVRTTISPIYDEGEKIGYASIRQDITDKKIIEELSIKDPLTQAYNRRYFNDIFMKLQNSAKRNGKYICFIMIDIDHFKEYNDTYGHHKGDEVLVAVSKAITGQLRRANDHFFRLGGEEFGIIAEGETTESCVELAEDVRQSVESLNIKHLKNSVAPYVTISLGVICIASDKTKSLIEIYKKADELLYLAKDKGRNNVQV